MIFLLYNFCGHPWTRFFVEGARAIPPFERGALIHESTGEEKRFAFLGERATKNPFSKGGKGLPIRF
jgi:hypothetical protein